MCDGRLRPRLRSRPIALVSRLLFAFKADLREYFTAECFNLVIEELPTEGTIMELDFVTKK